MSLSLILSRSGIAGGVVIAGIANTLSVLRLTDFAIMFLPAVLDNHNRRCGMLKLARNEWRRPTQLATESAPLPRQNGIAAGNQQRPACHGRRS
jgi:hypothetical protein